MHVIPLFLLEIALGDSPSCLVSSYQLIGIALFQDRTPEPFTLLTALISA